MIGEQRKSGLSPEVIAALHAQARLRFKSAIRFVIDNLSWIREELEERDSKVKDFYRQLSLATDTRHERYLFPYKLKYLMLSKLEHRTPEMEQRILHHCRTLPCFRGYPVEVREKLTMKSRYILVPPNKVMISPGSMPMAAYCLINGLVAQAHMALDPVTRLPEGIDDGVKKPGKIIGESSLTSGLTQFHKYTTLTACDFLVVPAEIFVNTLNVTVKPLWNDIITKLKYFPHFEDWDSLQMIQCARNCVVETFERSETVLGDGYGIGTSVYFITSGFCQLIHDFDVERVNLITSIQYRLASNQPDCIQKCELDRHSSLKQQGSTIIGTTLSQQQNNQSQSESERDTEIRKQLRFSKLNPSSGRRSSLRTALQQYQKMKKQTDREKKSEIRKETKFVQICTLRKGHIFNVGESLSHRRVIALKRTECITIPREWLLRRNQDNRFQKQRIYLETVIPNDTVCVFGHYCRERKWKDYKKSLIDDILQRLKGGRKLVTTIHDVPYHYRMENGTDLSLF